MTSLEKGKTVFFVSVSVLLFLACYHDVLRWMYSRYVSADSYYSHGFLIPFVSAYLIWDKRGEWAGVDVRGCAWGFFIVAGALLMHVVGTAFYVYSLSGFSILILLLGVSVSLLGTSLTRILLFPLIFLIFMFPAPMALIEAFSFPLKMMVARAGVFIVDLMGIPVFRSGFHITIPEGELLVGNPCSGLRSLLTFLCLGSLLAHMTHLSALRKVLLVFFSIPVALLSNVVRVTLLILISQFWGLAAASPDTVFHTATGILMFALGFVLFVGIAYGMGWKR